MKAVKEAKKVDSRRETVRIYRLQAKMSTFRPTD